MTVQKISKKVTDRFSISFSEAKRLGITDEDLKYITEIDVNNFRISIPAFDKRRTKLVHNLLDAIKIKYEMKKQIEIDESIEKKKNETIKDFKNNINRYSLVKDGIELYLKERYKDYERGFIQITTYEQDVKDYEKNSYLLKSGIYNKTIDEVDDECAQSFVNYLWDTKVQNGKNSGIRIAENTVYKPFSYIHKVFNYFKDDLKIIESNPFDTIKRKPHAVSKDKEYFTDEEMHYIKEKLEFENIRFRTLITFMMDMGCRREEALAIKFGDINEFRKTISINRAFVKSKLDYRYIIKSVKRKKSEREIICTSYVLELINKYKKFKEACGFIVSNDDFVFTSWDSMEIIDPDRYSREFKKFLEKIGIKKQVPLKNLRHTNASFFVSKGSNLKALQNRVGHENIETTLSYYAQSNFYEDKKLVQEYENEFYNKLGVSMADLYRIVSNRFFDSKKLISVLEKLSNEYIDSTNYDIQLERCQRYFKQLFPIFEKILNIDSLIDDDEIDNIFSGFAALYHNTKIESLESLIRI